MELQKVLVRRQSIRQYNDVMPTEEEVEAILDAGRLGPVVRLHKLHFTVVTNKELMAEVEAHTDTVFSQMPMKMPKPYMYDAPMWIILSGKKYIDGTPENPFPAEPMNNNLYWTIGSILENMELKAVELGYAHCGINTTVVSLASAPELRAKLGIPDGYDALCSMVVGGTDAKIVERTVKKELIPVNWVK